MLRILFILSWRSLRGHKITTLIVGSIIFFGTYLCVSGTALLDSMERSLAKTVISSVAGHLQVYSASARDDLALFGSGFAALDDVGQMPNFARVRQVLQTDTNVRAVVPMGIGVHALVSGNELDKVLDRLRRAVQAGNETRTDALARQVRDIARDIEHELEQRAVVSADQRDVRASLAAVRRVRTASFWQALRAEPNDGLQFLDTQVAPLAGTIAPLYLRNLGTDLNAFTRTFDRFVMVDGEPVPPGTRGMLFAKAVYETQIKHPVAHTFDVIAKGLTEPGRSLASDPMLRGEAERLPLQYQRISFQLDPTEAARLRPLLEQQLNLRSEDLGYLLRAFLQVDDANFQARYHFFYTTIAPMVRLYSVQIGDTITLQALTHSGYTKSVRVRVYGTFEFAGLSRTVMAGTHNLMDLMTLRDLYGARDAEQEQELTALRNSVTVTDINREDAEAQMFGHSKVRAVRARASESPSTYRALADARRQRRQSTDTFTQDDIDNGLALNAAVMLKDASRLESTRRHLTIALSRAGLPVRLVDWREASGLLSRFVTVVHLFLYVATGVIFLVALVIMSNAMTMATSERSREIGTIRAMGGQRRFVLTMYCCETLTLGILAGSLGALTAWLSILWLQQHGIAAASDVLVFIFSGPRLYPQIGFLDLAFGMALVMVATIGATLYPARVAARIAPVVAMAPKE